MNNVIFEPVFNVAITSKENELVNTLVLSFAYKGHALEVAHCMVGAIAEGMGLGVIKDRHTISYSNEDGTKWIYADVNEGVVHGTADPTIILSLAFEKVADILKRKNADK